MKLISHIKATDFSVKALFITGVALGSIAGFRETLQIERAPSSLSEGIELKLNKISTESTGKLRSLRNSFVRVHFGDKGQEIREFFKDNPFSLTADQSLDLDISIDLKDNWLHNNDLAFRIDIVEKSFVETVAFRCNTVATNIKSYDRVFNCYQPDSNSVVLSYRLGKKGTNPIKAPSVAKK